MHNFDFPTQAPTDPSTALENAYQDAGPMPASWYAAGGYSVDEKVLADAQLTIVDGIIIAQGYATVADIVRTGNETAHMDAVMKYLDAKGPLPVGAVKDPDVSAAVEVLVAAGILTRTSHRGPFDFYAKTDRRGYALMFPCMTTDHDAGDNPLRRRVHMPDGTFTVADLEAKLESIFCADPWHRAMAYIRQGILAAVLEPVVSDGDVAYRPRLGVPTHILYAGMHGSAGTGEVGDDMLAVALRETVNAYGPLSIDALGTAHGVEMPCPHTAPEELAELAAAAGVSVELDTFITGGKGLSLNEGTALGIAAREVWRGMCINGPSPTAHAMSRGGFPMVTWAVGGFPMVTWADALAAMRGLGIVETRGNHDFLVGSDGTRTTFPIRDRSADLSPERSEKLGAEVLAAYGRFTVADVAEMLRNEDLYGEDGDEDILAAAAIVHDLGAAGRIRLDVDAADESSAVYVAV